MGPPDSEGGSEGARGEGGLDLGEEGILGLDAEVHLLSHGITHRVTRPVPVGGFTVYGLGLG